MTNPSAQGDGDGKTLNIGAAPAPASTPNLSPSSTPSSGAASASTPPIISLDDEPTPIPGAPKPTAPTTASASASPAPAALKDEAAKSLPNIFTQKKKKMADTGVMTSVLKKKNTGEKAKSILGSAPLLQQNIEEERTVRLQRKLRLTKVIFAVLFLLGLASAGYFYAELSPTFDLFGPNTTQNLAITNENLRSVQTKINKSRYQAAQLSLNRFSFWSDRFLDATAQLEAGDVTSTQRAELEQTVRQAMADLPVLLEDIRTQLNQDIIVPTVLPAGEEEQTPEQQKLQAENALRAALLSERGETLAALNNAPEAEKSGHRQDLELIDNTLKLVGNTALLATVRSASVDNFTDQLEAYVTDPNSVTRQELERFMSSILSSTKSHVSVIGSLKAQRIEWSSIIQQIEDETRRANPTFGSGVAASLGEGIFYTGYDFDTASNKIILSGITKTTLADNFTLITKLIDALEISPHFRDVEMRSFTKAGSFSQGFTSSFKIDLALESSDDL